MTSDKERLLARMRKLAVQAEDKPPPLDIEPMGKCLHGHPCEHLDAPGGVSPMCHEAVNGIFKIKECPLGYWWFNWHEYKPPEPEPPKPRPGDCENCPASGTWEWGEYAKQGLLCCYDAYYLGKSGRPKPCSEMREQCPKGL